MKRHNPISQKRYEEMFKGYQKLYDLVSKKLDFGVRAASREFYRTLRQEIAGIRVGLETDDQKIVILKYIRDKEIYDLLSDFEKKMPGALKDYGLEKILKKAEYSIADFTEGPADEAPDFIRIYRTLNHYFDQARNRGWQSVLRTKFSNKSWQTIQEDLEKATQNEQEKAKGTGIAHYDEIFLNIDDNWAWFIDYKGYCEETADYMGHCGNANPHNEDAILNLGEKSKKGYIPRLTFILNNGVLGEMKGAHNQKPQAKYHPQILKLLADPRIKALFGGGYKPEANFDLLDLSSKDTEWLKKRRPDLFKVELAVREDPESIHDFLHNYNLIPKNLLLKNKETIFLNNNKGGLWKLCDAVEELDRLGEVYATEFMEGINYIEQAFENYQNNIEIDNNSVEWDLVLESLLKRKRSRIFKDYIKPHIKIEDGYYCLSDKLMEVIRWAYRDVYISALEGEYLQNIYSDIYDAHTASMLEIKPVDNFIYYDACNTEVRVEGVPSQVLSAYFEVRQQDEGIEVREYKLYISEPPDYLDHSIDQDNFWDSFSAYIVELERPDENTAYLCVKVRAI